MNATYYDLTTAEDEAGMARFHGVEDGICYDPAKAIAHIDKAIAALVASRNQLTEKLDS